MKKFRFYVGRFCMQVGLYIMPMEARASFMYNVNFLRKMETKHENT